MGLRVEFFLGMMWGGACLSVPFLFLLFTSPYLLSADFFLCALCVLCGGKSFSLCFFYLLEPIYYLLSSFLDSRSKDLWNDEGGAEGSIFLE